MSRRWLPGHPLVAESNTPQESHFEEGTETLQVTWTSSVWKPQPAPVPAHSPLVKTPQDRAPTTCPHSPVHAAGLLLTPESGCFLCHAAVQHFLGERLKENTYHTIHFQIGNAHSSLTVIVRACFHNTIRRSQESGHILSVFLQDKRANSAHSYLLFWSVVYLRVKE